MMTAIQAAQWCGGECRGDGARKITGVKIDSREIRMGELFVALAGSVCDGHDFVADAARRGAAAALVSRPATLPNDIKSLAQIVVVEGAMIGLGRLAGAWRARFDLPLAAVTGTNGKTTVKEMLAGILRAHCGNDSVLSSEGNFNNCLGAPLTLLKLRKHHQFAVIELGMNRAGEIAKLASLACPSIAIITNAQRGHLANFEGRGGGGDSAADLVARAKGEIIGALSPNGIAVINGDDSHSAMWKKMADARRVLTFGINSNADCRAKKTSDDKVAFVFQDGGGIPPLRLADAGEHNLRNAAAAALTAHVLGIGGDDIKRGLENFRGIPGRLQFKKGIGGCLLIDDTYNANPDSARAALSALALQSERKIFVLGDMLELGGASADEHRAFGKDVAAANIEHFFAMGEMSRYATQAVPGAKHFEDADSLIRTLIPLTKRGGGVILVKGSRGMKMEKIIHALEEEGGDK